MFILVVITQSKITCNSYLNVIAVLHIILYSNIHEHNHDLGLTESYQNNQGIKIKY